MLRQSSVTAIRAEFNAIDKGDHPHPDATIYISRSCAADASLAPAGKENWFVLVNAPARGSGSFDGDATSSVWKGHAEQRAELV
ncbi:MAG: hypothetical protein ACKOE4_02775, partial [Candidatus Kapaibacterium sp.]